MVSTVVNKEFSDYFKLLLNGKDDRKFDLSESKLFIMLFTVEEEKELFKKAKEIFRIEGEEASLAFLRKEVVLPYLSYKLRNVNKLSTVIF